LPLADDARAENVANDGGDPTSIYNLYRRLLSLRRSTPALTLGSYRPIVASGDLLLFAREHGSQRILVALNLRRRPAVVSSDKEPWRGRLLLSTCADRAGERVDGDIALRADEGVVVQLY